MAYRKITADHLFTGFEMAGSGAVLVVNEEGRVEAIVDASAAGEGIERWSGVLSPGFINCHCHLELSHMKGIIAERSGMVSFLLSVMNNRNHSIPVILEAIEKAETEMIANGVVAVGDICNTDHTITQKKKSNLYYHNFIEATGFIEATAHARFDASVELYKKFETLGASSIVPHAPYSVSPLLFSLISDHHLGSLITMHNQESKAENEFFIHAKGDFLKLYAALGLDIQHFKGTGKSSLASIIEHLSNDHQVILVHNVLTGKEDLELLKNRMDTVYWCLCPNANRYINEELPDVQLLKEYTDKLVLGTDSLASNHQLNIWEEMKTLQQKFPQLKLSELLQWATINGAKALGIDNMYGSFEKGKRPGVININEGKITRII